MANIKSTISIADCGLRISDCEFQEIIVLTNPDSIYIKKGVFLIPRSGYVAEPRVAAHRGYPGNDKTKDSNPNGVVSSSPGLPPSATLGQRFK